MSIKTLDNVSRKSAGVYTPQRLDTENLTFAYLVGLIEGDGWLSFTKNGKYIIFEMGLELNVRDIQLLYRIKTLFGVVNIIVHKVNKKARYSVRNKEHLIKTILPIFYKYPMLSNKNIVYLKFKHLIQSKCIYYSEIKSLIESTVFKAILSSNLEKIKLFDRNVQKGVFPSYFSA